MDADVAALVRQERLLEAAELASSRGDARTASTLFERACAWSHAAREAERAGDPVRALGFAVEARDDALASTLVREVAKNAASVAQATSHLERRGAHAWAARVYEAAGRAVDAARAWERSGDAGAAAALYESAGSAVDAARVLEAAIRRDDTQFELHLALGALLVRYAKYEAAARVLQKVPRSSDVRRGALAELVRALEPLGLAQARAEAQAELDALGGALEAHAAIPRAEVATRLFGRYDVVREVATTPTARVLECIDAVRGERVALKVFAGYEARGAGRDALVRFEREVRVQRAIDHPNVVPLRDYFAEGPAIVLDWMDGGTLEALLARGGLTPARAIEIANAMLQALGEAHRRGVLHRDIKPSNVLFDAAGVARLSDFGVAHLGDLSTTATAAVIGTLAYMSPEQREGRPATVRSDLYGVGALLLEMLTGSRPADGGRPPKTLPSGAHRELDARHDALVLALLAPDESERPQDAFAARRALTALRWPDAIEPAAPERPESRAPSERPAGGARVRVELDGRVLDPWTGRAVLILPLGDALLARARLFARADHPTLQAILRVDRDDGTLWLEAPRGAQLATALDRRALGDLQSALSALHAAGYVHGAIDPEHIFVDADGDVMLAFAEHAPSHGSVDDDRAQLATLSARLG